jgi:hypothetical protein
MKTKLFFVSLILIIYLVGIGGSINVENKKYIDTFKDYEFSNKSDWTILNLENSGYTSQEIKIMLDSIYAYNVINYTIKDIQRDTDELLFYTTPATIGSTYHIFGKENYTLVLLNKHDYQTTTDRFLYRIVGGGLPQRAYALTKHGDSNYDAALRILHEISHGKQLDADGMFTTQRDNFSQWLNTTNHPYKNNYHERPFQNYKTIELEQLYLDYHLWLYTT